MPWTCPVCTLVNDDGAVVCRACGAAKPTIRQLKKILTNKGVNWSKAVERPNLEKLLTPPAPAGWACPVCTLQNPAGADKCGVCGTARPTAAPAAAPAAPAAPGAPANSLANALAGMRPAGAHTSRFRGLRNLGNTCWMNSSLQALLSCEDFAELFIRRRGKLPLLREPADLARALINTYSACDESPVGTVVDPTEFKAVLQRLNPEYRGRSQKDAGIFFTHLFGFLELQTGHPAGVRPMLWEPTLFPSGLPPPSIVRDLHGIKKILSKRCNVCGTARIKRVYDDILRLSIPEPQADGQRITLMNCFEAFSEGILYEGENMIECPTCTKIAQNRGLPKNASPENIAKLFGRVQKTPHTEKTLLENSPEMLVVNIMRFDISNPDEAKKSDTPVSIPLVLETLGPLVERAQDSAYVLTGVVCHSGTINSGHYTATVMKPNRQWLLCNDSTLTHIPQEEFEADMLNQTGPFNAVVMVYSKGWKCTCTRVNPKNSPICDACESWRCPLCSLVNEPGEAACGACGTSKPGAGARGGSLFRKTKRRKYTKRRRVCRTRCIKKQNRS